jgi:hypothetical protein
LLKLQKLLKFTIKIENKQINFDVGVGRKTGKKKGRIITKDSNQKYNDFYFGQKKNRPLTYFPLQIIKDHLTFAN